MSSRLRLSLLLAGTLIFAACTPAHRLYLRHGDTLSRSELRHILAQNPLGEGQNIRVVNLGKTQSVSHHIVQIRDREIPHFHKRHDLTVVVLKGHGYLVLAGERLDVATGDILFIPRAAVHQFVNQGSDIAVALVLFSPPFDGQDTVPMPAP